MVWTIQKLEPTYLKPKLVVIDFYLQLFSQNKINDLLNIFVGLEDQVNGIIDNEVLSTTITMLLRDLSSMRHYMALDNKNKDSDNV